MSLAAKTILQSTNRSRAIAQQVGQRERRIARFLSSLSVAAAALPWTLGDQPQNRNEPQVHTALEALLLFDTVSHARLRTTVCEPLGELRPLIIAQQNDACTAQDHEHKTQSHNSARKSVAL